MGGVFVPEAQRLPSVSKLSDILTILTTSRTMVTWQPVGLAWGLYDVCAKYLEADAIAGKLPGDVSVCLATFAASRSWPVRSRRGRAGKGVVYPSWTRVRGVGSRIAGWEWNADAISRG